MRIAHLSDLHVGKSDREWPATRRLVGRVAALGADALVVSGDLVDDPVDDALAHAVRLALEESGLPVLVVPGNHDVVTPGDNRQFEREWDAYPRVQWVGEGAFVLLDSFGGLPLAARTPEDHECYQNTGCWLDGRVHIAGLRSIEQQLAATPDRQRFAVVHHHLQPSPDAPVNPLLNAPELCAWCVAHDIQHVFVGHWHETAPPARVHGVWRYRIGRSTKANYPIGLLDTSTGDYTILVDG